MDPVAVFLHISQEDAPLLPPVDPSQAGWPIVPAPGHCLHAGKGQREELRNIEDARTLMKYVGVFVQQG